jgi:glycosyltransferase involved in cell wall biosynthesis
MTICYFGDFDKEYIRNVVIINGLKENGAKVLLCNTKEKGFSRFFKLFKLHKRSKDKYDILIVGSSGTSRPLVLLARIISRKFLIWDAHYSLYDSWVFDRKLITPNSLKARYYWFLDWLSCKLADKILLDTNEHIKYFVKTFKIKKDKFIKTLVGANTDIFYPVSGLDSEREEMQKECFLISFYGKFIPLQGVQYIIRAAKILEKHPDIKFQIIGKGQTYSKAIKLAQRLKIKNTDFVDRVPQEELPKHIQRTDVCLGIFGDTPKTQRVIPNKVYEAVAMKKPVITADTPAIRELFTNRENILLCKTANLQDLAKKILELKNNKKLRSVIAQGGYEVFKNHAIPKIIGKNLLKELSNNING